MSFETGNLRRRRTERQTRGEIAWKNERPIGTAHATSLLVEHHGQKDILVPGKIG